MSEIDEVLAVEELFELLHPSGIFEDGFSSFWGERFQDLEDCFTICGSDAGELSGTGISEGFEESDQLLIAGVAEQMALFEGDFPGDVVALPGFSGIFDVFFEGGFQFIHQIVQFVAVGFGFFVLIGECSKFAEFSA